MTIAQVIPMVEHLPHADKFKLMQYILVQLEKEEKTPVQTLSKKNDTLFDIVGVAEGEDAEVARNHDQYLYGK
jgi:hypothetical protein